MIAWPTKNAPGGQSATKTAANKAPGRVLRDWADGKVPSPGLTTSSRPLEALTCVFYGMEGLPLQVPCRVSDLTYFRQCGSVRKTETLPKKGSLETSAFFDETAQRAIDRVGVGKGAPNVGVEGNEALGAQRQLPVLATNDDMATAPTSWGWDVGVVDLGRRFWASWPSASCLPGRRPLLALITIGSPFGGVGDSGVG